MQGLSKQRALESLRARIAHIEKRPPLAGAGTAPQRGGSAAFAVPAGMLHEVFTASAANAGAALGFAFGAARGLLTPARPAIVYLQLMRDGRSAGLPYGAGLERFGLTAENLVLCRVETPIELLWAAEEAVGCGAVAAVIADIDSPMKALDFTASRRLSLRAAAAGSTAFILRYGAGREASAARLRWRVEPAASGEVAFDPRAPGGPRWRVELEKGRSGAAEDPVNWIMDWTENGFALVEPQSKPALRPAARAALPGAQPAALGDRLSQAG